MIKVFALGFVAVLASTGDGALAAASAPAIPAPHCETIDAMKASVKGAKFTALSQGQFHFMAGVYVASPITPPGGMPPGDGALLIEIKDKAAVVWTRGKQACITQVVIDAEHQAAYVRFRSTPSSCRSCGQSRPAPTKRPILTIPVKSAGCEARERPRDGVSQHVPLKCGPRSSSGRSASSDSAGFFSRSQRSADEASTVLFVSAWAGCEGHDRRPALSSSARAFRWLFDRAIADRAMA